MTLTKESLVLIAICAADLIATLFLMRGGEASEGNPVMAFYLRYGIGTFIMMKVTLIFAPVFIFEWCKQFKPDFVKMMLRTTIVAYVAVYAMLFLLINVGL